MGHFVHSTLLISCINEIIMQMLNPEVHNNAFHEKTTSILHYDFTYFAFIKDSCGQTIFELTSWFPFSLFLNFH